MIGRLGGKSKPKLPDVVTSPSANFSEYCSEISIGNTKPPSATIVTPEPPVNAVNTAQLASTTTASPPGIQPMSACANATMRFGALLSARKYPATVNNGIASSTGWLASRYNSTITAAVSIPCDANPYREIAPIIVNSGAPRNTSAMRASTTSMIFISAAPLQHPNCRE